MRRITSRLLVGLCTGGALLAGSQLFAQRLTSYEVKVETQPGVVVVTFSVESGQARVYLPDDLAPAEPFSGSIEANQGYLLEFCGETEETRSGAIHGTVPAVASGEFLPLVLKTLKGQELARASIRITSKAGASNRAGAFRVPKFVRAGNPFPILGPFDGDSRSTSVFIADKRAPVLAESTRKAVVKAPGDGGIVGLAPYRMIKNGVDKTGDLRNLAIEINPSTAARRDNDPPVWNLSVKGLAGIEDDVPLRVAQNYFYLRPDLIPPSGTFVATRVFDGVNPAEPSAAAHLIIPQSPEEEVAVILRTPRRESNTRDPGREHAQALRRLNFDTIPLLANFLTDFDLGSDAAYAMLDLDENRALALLFATMPQSGQNIERLTLTWFLDRYDFVHGSRNTSEAHAAAVRLLDHSATTATVIVELALYAVGLTGSDQDFPLLEKFYGSQNRWEGLKGTHDASEAALTRLGSRKHLEVIRAELAPPLPGNATLPQGLLLVQSLEKAGYAGNQDLVPEVCAHIGDPIVLEIDISTNPSQHAMSALSAIVDKANPRSTAGRRTLDDWRAYCQAPAAR